MKMRAHFPRLTPISCLPGLLIENKESRRPGKVWNSEFLRFNQNARLILRLLATKHILTFSGIENRLLKLSCCEKVVISWLPGFLIEKRVLIRNPGDQDSSEIVSPFALNRKVN